ncbi:Putative L-type lectin-domain containing receptor kinase I.4 [Leucoagaricus sp. SymC.cos]|nr:Putative L-type lectin-domain containing receptor kinase I.4 [Leucoagaricus sp. SymC.cos]
MMITRTIMLYAGEKQGEVIPHQMAPELLRGRLTGLEGDIWALGWTCCEIIGVPCPRGQIMHVEDVPKRQKPPEAISWTEDRKKIWSQVVKPCCKRKALKRPTAGRLLTKIRRLNSHDTRPPDLDPFSSATARAPTEIDMDRVELLLQSLLQQPPSATEERSALLETISDEAEPSSSSSPVAIPVSKSSPLRIVAATARSTVPDSPVSTVDRGATSGTLALPEKASPSSSSSSTSALASTDAPSPTFAKSPITKSFSDARSWVLDVVGPTSVSDGSRPDMKHLQKSLSALGSQDAQFVIDFLDELLMDENVKGNVRSRILSLLYLTARSVTAVPRRLEIQNVNCDFTDLFADGGLAGIYKGDLSGLTVCVKRPRNPRFSDSILLASIGELIISAHTSHKNIVPFYGAYRYQGRIWAHVSALMELGGLPQYLTQNPKAPRIPFIADIISGLNYLHEKDIIFADVKAVCDLRPC